MIRACTLGLSAALAAAALAGGPARADDICEAAALRDVPALGNPSSVIRKGGKDMAITEFRVNVRTGETSYCSHGGYCYPTHVRVGDDLLLALKMTNCKPADKPYGPDPGEPDVLTYGVAVIRSRIPAAAMRREDVKNRFLGMGLCSACADNVAQYYVAAPKSECAGLARSALEGNPDAVARITAFPDFCQWHYPQ